MRSARQGAARLSYAIGQIVNCLHTGRSSALERPFFARASEPASVDGHSKCVSAGKAGKPEPVSSSQPIALGRGLRLQRNGRLGACPRSIASAPGSVRHRGAVWQAAGNDCSAAGAYPRRVSLKGSSSGVSLSASCSTTSADSADTDASRRKQTNPRSGA